MTDDTDVNRAVRKRTANQSILKNLLNKEEISLAIQKKACNDLESLISVTENKFQIINEHDLEIFVFVYEDLIEAEITRAAEFKLEHENSKHIMNNFLEENRPKDKESFLYPSNLLNVS